jgi:hypothetical protein
MPIAGNSLAISRIEIDLQDWVVRFIAEERDRDRKMVRTKNLLPKPLIQVRLTLAPAILVSARTLISLASAGMSE